MTQSEFLKRWLMHYVHPEYFYVPWSDHQVGTVTLNLTLTDSPHPEVTECLCSFYIYHVETEEYMEFTKYGDWYVGKPIKISGESGDVITISPCFTDISGEITLRLPFGTYQYIEYECVYGKIKKQPVQFTVDKTDRTVTISHLAAYLHTWIGKEESINSTQYVVSEREYKWEDALFPLPAGREAYYRPYNAGYEFLTGSVDNTDRQGFQFGRYSHPTPSGHYTRIRQHHYWHQKFATTMDWAVQAETKMLYESPWSTDEVITYTSAIDFDEIEEQTLFGYNTEGYWASVSIWGSQTAPAFARGNGVQIWGNKSVNRNMSYKWQDCILPHPIMEYYVNDKLDKFSHELNGAYVLDFRDDTFSRSANWIYNVNFPSSLNSSQIETETKWYVENPSYMHTQYSGYYFYAFLRGHTNITGTEGEKYYDVLDEATGVITTYTETYTPQYEYWSDAFVYQFTYDWNNHDTYPENNPYLIVNSSKMVEIQQTNDW